MTPERFWTVYLVVHSLIVTFGLSAAAVTNAADRSKTPPVALRVARQITRWIPLAALVSSALALMPGALDIVRPLYWYLLISIWLTSSIITGGTLLIGRATRNCFRVDVKTSSTG